MISKIDVLVVGAGVAGLSTACAVSERSSLSVLVIEAEASLGGHASGRNAGMVRQTVPDPWIARLALQGQEALQKASRSARWKRFSYHATGSILLSADEPSEALLRAIQKTAREVKIKANLLTQNQAAGRCPLLEAASLLAATRTVPWMATVVLGGLGLFFR